MPTDEVELITLALIYKFMDDLDEDSVKLAGKRSFFTGSLAKYCWRNSLPQTVSADKRMLLFAEGSEAIVDLSKNSRKGFYPQISKRGPSVSFPEICVHL